MTGFGFELKARKNINTNNGHEGVYFKSMEWREGIVESFNYPLVQLKERNFLLSIWPKWHTRLFPESKLHNENESTIEDASHTNSINKVYLTKMRGTNDLKKGDNLLIYRTTDGQGSARFRSVVTSVCVVQEIRNINSFATEAEFITYCDPYSVFDKDELKLFFKQKQYPIIIRFSYHFPLRKRVTRGDIMDITGYTDQDYFGCLPISNSFFKKIVKQGEVNESYLVDQT